MEYLHYIFFDNSLRNLLIVFGSILIVLICKKPLSRYLASLLFIPIQKKWKSVAKDEFIGLIINPLGRFLFVGFTIIALSNLNYPHSLSFTLLNHSINKIFISLGNCTVIIFFIWVIQSFINFVALVLDRNALANKDKRDDQLIVFFRDFVKVFIYIIGILTILKIGLGIDVGAVLTGLSIVGAALALAAKESIENLIASFIIFFDKPFFTGDVVKLNNNFGTLGTVEHIGLRSTRIRTNEDTLVTVPNKQMVDSIVDNWSLRTSRRNEIRVELDFQNPSNLIEDFIASTKKHLDSLTTIKKQSVFLTDFSKSNLTITVEYFTENIPMEKFLQLKQEVNIQIKNLIELHDLKVTTGGKDIRIYSGEFGNGSNNINNEII